MTNEDGGGPMAGLPGIIDAEFDEAASGVPLRDKVFAQLEAMIIDHELPPGAHLTEVEIARTLGVSRNPVREALAALSREGWVTLRPRQGAFVRIPTDEEIRQFFNVRRILEVEAARLAAFRVTDQHLVELDRIVQVGRKASDGMGVVRANTAFHGVVWDMCGNRLLADLLATQSKKMKWYFASVAVRRAPDSWAEHTEIFDALRAGDAEWAADITDRHCRKTAAATAKQRRLERWERD